MYNITLVWMIDKNIKGIMEWHNENLGERFFCEKCLPKLNTWTKSTIVMDFRVSERVQGKNTNIVK